MATNEDLPGIKLLLQPMVESGSLIQRTDEEVRAIVTSSSFSSFLCLYHRRALMESLFSAA